MLDKRILKQIAKDWCKATLLANGMDSFDNDLLTHEEQAYVVDESHRIAERITKEKTLFDLNEIIKRQIKF